MLRIYSVARNCQTRYVYAPRDENGDAKRKASPLRELYVRQTIANGLDGRQDAAFMLCAAKILLYC